jgi:hypothetical protein
LKKQAVRCGQAAPNRFFSSLALWKALQDGKTLHREDAKDAKKDKSKRENAVFRNKIGFSSFFSSSLRPSRLRVAYLAYAVKNYDHRRNPHDVY